MMAEGASAISNLEDILDISEEELKALLAEARKEYEEKKEKLELQKTVLKAMADSEREAAKKRDEAAKEYLQITMGLQKFVKETGLEKTKADLRKMIADGTFKGMLKDPTFDQMVTWKRQQQKAKGTETLRQHASKAIARLPKFLGDEHKLTWEAFMTHISVITSNIDYTEAEIKQILVGALEGAAFQFLNANPELLEKPYGELIEALRKEFQQSHPQALALLQGAKQMPKESVREFASRIKIYSKAISPSAPPPIQSYERPDLNTTQLVLNRLEEIEEYDYRARMEMVGTLQLDSFLAGLRAQGAVKPGEPPVERSTTERQVDGSHDYTRNPSTEILASRATKIQVHGRGKPTKPMLNPWANESRAAKKLALESQEFCRTNQHQTSVDAGNILRLERRFKCHIYHVCCTAGHNKLTVRGTGYCVDVLWHKILR